MCWESQRQSKRRNKRYHHPWIQWRSLSWWLGSSGGRRTPGGLDLLVVGTCSKGLAPSPFIPSGCPSHSFPKVLKNESVGMGRRSRLGGLTFLPRRQLPCLHDIGGFCKRTPCLSRVSLCLPQSLINEEVPKAQCLI